jgi:hypothetical protein
MNKPSLKLCLFFGIFGKRVMIAAFKGKLGLLFRFNMQQQLTSTPTYQLGETLLLQHCINPLCLHPPLLLKATDVTLMLLRLQIYLLESSDWLDWDFLLLTPTLLPPFPLFIKASMQDSSSVRMAESVALALAITFCRQMDLQHISFFTDNQLLVNCITGEHSSDPQDWRIKPYTQLLLCRILTKCNARVLAPNKSPNKSRVFFKTVQLSSFAPFQNPGHRPPSLTLGARAANPASTARTRASTHAYLPSAAVGHRAGNPAHAAVPPTGPPRHRRRPENHADARKTGKPTKKPFL